MSADYYLKTSRRVYGPCSLEDLQTLIKDARVGKDDLYSVSSDGPWQALSELKELEPQPLPISALLQDRPESEEEDEEHASRNIRQDRAGEEAPGSSRRKLAERVRLDYAHRIARRGGERLNLGLYAIGIGAAFIALPYIPALRVYLTELIHRRFPWEVSVADVEPPSALLKVVLILCAAVMAGGAEGIRYRRRAAEIFKTYDDERLEDEYHAPTGHYRLVKYGGGAIITLIALEMFFL